MLSPYPLQDKGLDKPISTNIFKFFNLKDLSKLTQVCKVWEQFIKDDICKVNEDIILKINAYRESFKLYYCDGGFLLDIRASNFFSMNKNFKDVLDQNVAEDMPFIKACSASSCLARFNMYFWSSDGFDFHLMQQKPRGSSNNNEQTVYFSTSEEVSDIENICRIKFYQNKAILLESEIIEKKINAEITEEILEFSLDDFIGNCVPPPEPKELRLFSRCPRKAEELLVQFILSNKINMLPYLNQIKPLHFFHFNENDWLFIGKQDNQTIIKVRKDYRWNDINPGKVLMTSDGSGSMHIPVKDHSEFQLIKIMNPNSNNYQAFIQTKNDKKINLTKMDLNEHDLSKIGLIDNRGMSTRPTPLDVVEKLSIRNS